MLKYVPNTLTILRFILIPIILYFIFTGNYLLGFIFFTLSGITDILDGTIARKFNLISNFGKLMDPLADKLTQISVLAALVIKDIIPIWILIIVMLKELVMENSYIRKIIFLIKHSRGLQSHFQASFNKAKIPGTAYNLIYKIQ